MNYGSLAVFIRNDSAEIWGFRYGLTLVIGTLKKIMASNGVFERIILRRNQTYFYGPISESGPIIGPYFQRTSAKLCAPEKAVFSVAWLALMFLIASATSCARLGASLLPVSSRISEGDWNP